MDINHIPRAPSGLSRRILACVLTAAVFCTGCLAAEPQAAQPAGSSEGISSVESKNAREQEPEAVSSSLDPEISAPKRKIQSLLSKRRRTDPAFLSLEEFMGMKPQAGRRRNVSRKRYG